MKSRAGTQTQDPRSELQGPPWGPQHPCSQGSLLTLCLAGTVQVLPCSSEPMICPPMHRGRFGVVRACRENATGRTFVAKIVPYAAEGKRRVLQEYEVLRTLHHERLMALHEAYITPRYLVLIAESCGNRELLCGLSDRWLGIWAGRELRWGSWARLSPDSPIPPDSGIQRMMWPPMWCSCYKAWTTSMAATCCTWTSSQTTCCWPLTTPSRSWTLAVPSPTTPRLCGPWVTARAHWSSWVRAPCHLRGEWGTGKGAAARAHPTSPTHMAFIECLLYVSRELSPFRGFFSIFLYSSPGDWHNITPILQMRKQRCRDRKPCPIAFKNICRPVFFFF